MKGKITKRQILNKMIISALRETIIAHGPISKILIGSAAKRITGRLLSKSNKLKFTPNE